MSQLRESELSQREVPDHRVDAFRPKGSRHVVVLFVINEGEKVRKQLAGMRDLAERFDVVVADGGSTDGSLDAESLRSWNVRALLTKTGPGKLSAQMRMAFAWALDEGYEGVITIDGNGKDDPAPIPEFSRLLDDGVDHVQGSRFIPGGRAINTPLSRLVAVRVLHAPLISVAARERHTDTTNGFRAYSAKLLADDRIAAFREVFSRYELHYHLAIESSRDPRFRTAETPVTRSYPATGRTPTKISPIRGNAAVLRQVVRAALGRYRTKP